MNDVPFPRPGFSRIWRAFLFASSVRPKTLLLFLMTAFAVVLCVLAARAYLENAARTRAESASARYERMSSTLRDTDASPSNRAQILTQFVARHDDGYAVLASFRLARALRERGDVTAAAETFRRLARRADVPPSLRDLARLRGATLTSNAGGAPEDVESFLGSLLSESRSMSTSARELAGATRLAFGDVAGARSWFRQVRDDSSSSDAARERARLILSDVAEPAGDDANAATGGAA